ncbi:unnamed protein product [Amoebophrya sp. A120]|nr:unnamed protein product [Amoebophrya sp. A120]|eukprot:GSA120T00011730001.1
MPPPQLTANPSGCDGFQKNPFKPENCKKCGKSFLEHLGIISAQDLADATALYEQRIKKEEDRKNAKAADAHKKTFEARLEKQKEKKQAEEENDWFFDDDKKSSQAAKNKLPSPAAPAPSGAGGEEHIHMMTEDELRKANEQLQKKAQAGKANVQIKNLIDFAELEEEAKEHMAASRSLPTLDVPPPSDGSRSPHVGGAQTLPTNLGMKTSSPNTDRFDIAQDFGAPGQDINAVEELKAELAMLNEERTIQIEILRDEYESKIATLQKQLQEGGSAPSRPAREEQLEKQIHEKERLHQAALGEIAQLKEQLDEATQKRKQVEDRQASLQGLRETEAGNLREETTRLREESASSREELKVAREEVLRLKADLRGLQETGEQKETTLRKSQANEEAKALALANKVAALEAQIRAGRDEEATQLATLQQKLLASDKAIQEAENARDLARGEAEQLRLEYSEYKIQEQRRGAELVDLAKEEALQKVTKLQATHERQLEDQEQRHVAERTALQEEHMRTQDVFKSRLEAETAATRARIEEELAGRAAVLEREKGAEIQMLRTQVEQREAECEQLKERVELQSGQVERIPLLEAEAEQHRSDLSALLAEVAEHKKLEKEKEHKAADVEHRLAAKTTAMELQSAELATAEEKLFATEQALAKEKRSREQVEQESKEKIERDTASLRKRTTELETQLHSLIADSSKLGAMNTALKKELQQGKESLANALAGKEQADRDLQQKEKELQQVKDDSLLDVENLALRKELDDARKSQFQEQQAQMELDLLRKARLTPSGELGQDVLARYLGEQKSLYQRMLEQKDELIRKYDDKLNKGSASPLAARNRLPFAPEKRSSVENTPPPPLGVSSSNTAIATSAKRSDMEQNINNNASTVATKQDTDALRQEILRLRGELERQKADQKRLVDEAGRKAAQQAAKAFRDVRVNAEKQFGWLFARIPP